MIAIDGETATVKKYKRPFIKAEQKDDRERGWIYAGRRKGAESDRWRKKILVIAQFNLITFGAVFYCADIHQPLIGRA